MSVTALSVRPVRVLLVEDSPTQIVLARSAIEQSGRLELLHVANDGEEAMDYLHELTDDAEAPWPELILLDLNMPRKNGLEVLREVRADESLRAIPVILFTTSELPEDIAESYALGANTFITKPTRFNELLEALDDIGRYWSTAKLPTG